MKILVRILVALCGMFFCAMLALVLGGLAAQAGLLGSCFEGSCGYAGAFLVAPILFIVFTILFFAAWRRLRNRKR